MAGTIETFANISAQDLLRSGFRYYGWVRKADSTGIRKMLHMWPWRFMILSTGCLYLYEDSQDKSFCEKIALEKFRVCDAQDVSKYAWTFKLIQESYGGKPLFFAVDWELDLKQWEEVITEEKNIYWPLASRAEETRGVITTSSSTQPNPCERALAPLPEERHTYVNVPFKLLNVDPVPPQGPTTTGPPAHSPLLGSVNKPKPALPPKQSPSVLSLARPQEQPTNKGPPIKPRTHFSLSLSSGRIRKSNSETSVVQERFHDVLEQFSAHSHRIAEEQDPSSSSRSFSPTGVCTPRTFKPKTAGRGHPDGQSFKRNTREVVLSARMLDLDRNEAESLLQNEHEGVYILRNSHNVQSGMVLSVATKDETLHSEILYEKDQGYALAADGPTFHTIEDLLRHYRDGTTTLQRLTRPYKGTP